MFTDLPPIAATAAILAPQREMAVQAGRVAVYEDGARLVAIADPAFDTCGQQTAFVRDTKHLRIVAEWTRCFSKVENFTTSALVVRWSR